MLLYKCHPLFVKSSIDTMGFFCLHPMDINHLRFDFIHITYKWRLQKVTSSVLVTKGKCSNLTICLFRFCFSYNLNFKVRIEQRNEIKVYSKKFAFDMGKDNNNYLYFTDSCLYFAFYLFNQSAPCDPATRYETTVISRKKARIPQQIIH